MITIDLGSIQHFDDDTNEFSYEEGGIVRFEYSLKALYQWESKWRKPFLKGDINQEETYDLFKTMALDPIDDRFMTTEVMQQLSDYIAKPHTATVFTTQEGTGKKSNLRPKVYTSEELYALMFAAGVPLEFENRNLNRLLIVLRIISANNEPPKKMTKNEIFKQNQSLNQQRKAQMKTKG